MNSRDIGPVPQILAQALAPAGLSDAEALLLCAATDLHSLMAASRTLRDRGHGQLVT